MSKIRFDFACRSPRPLRPEKRVLWKVLDPLRFDHILCLKRRRFLLHEQKPNQVFVV